MLCISLANPFMMTKEFSSDYLIQPKNIIDAKK